MSPQGPARCRGHTGRDSDRRGRSRRGSHQGHHHGFSLVFVRHAALAFVAWFLRPELVGRSHSRDVEQGFALLAGGTDKQKQDGEGVSGHGLREAGDGKWAQRQRRRSSFRTKFEKTGGCQQQLRAGEDQKEEDQQGQEKEEVFEVVKQQL